MADETEVKPRRGRRPRTAEQEFYDVFADMDTVDQDAALRIMTEIHRQRRRGKLGGDKLSLAESAAAIGEEAQS
jgi:hypothetical protein